MAPSSQRTAAAAAVHNNAASSLKITRDPRFIAACSMIKSGQPETAITPLANLLKEARQSWGETSIETAPAYYEYGKALATTHYRSNSQQMQSQDAREAYTAKQQDARRELAADAADQRAAQANEEEEDKKPAAKPENGDEDQTQEEEEPHNDDDEEEDDLHLALDMMEMACSLVDEYLESQSDGDYREWAQTQSPRMLIGIGDVLSNLDRPADAVQVFCRALAQREATVENLTDDKRLLTARRLLCETYVLLAETLLTAPADQDLVTSHAQEVLVPAAERIDYVRGYYDKARDELQEAVLLMGRLASQGHVVNEEKEDVCFVATLVMGIGTMLAEYDEQQEEQTAAASSQPAKKQKR